MGVSQIVVFKLTELVVVSLVAFEVVDSLNVLVNLPGVGTLCTDIKHFAFILVVLREVINKLIK